MVALVAILAGLAIADDESDRRELVADIERKLDAMASELSGFESDSDVGDLDDALSYARELRDLVNKLDRVKGSDSRASEIASRYPGYIDQFREAARYLKRVKEGQRRADGAADRCASDEASLQGLIRGYVGKPGEADDAPTKLPESAAQHQRTWQPRLEQWKQNDSELASAASYARFSVSDGRWSYVSSNMNNANNAMHTYWRERYAAAERACTRLGLGGKHPDVVSALEELGRYTTATKATVTQLKKDYNAWLVDVRTLRAFSTKDRDELRNVMCSAGEYEMDRRVAELADRWASQISSAYGTTLGRADALRARAAEPRLSKYKGSAQVTEGVTRNVSSIESLKSYELLGSNNPRIRTKLEWGKKRHEEMQRGCQYSEVPVLHCSNAIRPGSGCIADCLKGCKVIEFKPDNSTARQEGDRQVEAYRAGFADWYKADKQGLFDKYSSLRACENSDKTSLVLEKEVVTYELCSSIVRNEFGEEIRDFSTDVSESSE